MRSLVLAALMALPLSLYAQAPTDLAIAVNCAPTGIAGTTIPCWVVVTNGGPAAATYADVMFGLKAAGELSIGDSYFVDFRTSGRVPMTCSGLGPDAYYALRCRVDALGAGESAAGVLGVSTSPDSPAGSTRTVTAQVFQLTPDARPANNISTSTNVIDRFESDLQLSCSAPAEVTGGANFDFVASLKTAGPSITQGVVFTYDVASGTHFVALTNGAAPVMTCETPAVGAGGTVRCTGSQGFLRSQGGRTSKITITMRAPQSGGNLVHLATVSSMTPDRDLTNNTATAQTHVTAVGADTADLSLTNTSSAASVATGGSVTYRLTIGNNGPATAKSVTVVDDLPAGMTLVSTTVPCSGTGPVSCTVGDLPNGSTASVGITAKAPDSSGAATNKARVTSATTDPIPANDNASCAVLVASKYESDLVLSASTPWKIVGRGGALGGRVDIGVKNKGPANAENVKIVASLAPGLTFTGMVRYDMPCTTPDAGGPGVVTCTMPLLSPQSGAGLSFFFNVAGDYPIDSDAIVVVSAHGDVPDPDPLTNAVEVRTNVRGLADLTGELLLNATVVRPLEDVVWTFKGSNRGPDTARQTRADFTLPNDAPIVSATPSIGACSVRSTVSCELGDMAPGAGAVITIATKAPNVHATYTASGGLSSVVDVDPTPNDGGVAWLTVAEETPADLSVSATPGPITAGTDSDIVFQVRNDGPGAAETVLFSTLTPPSTTFRGLRQTNGPVFTCQTPPIDHSGPIACSVSVLPAGAVAEFGLTVHNAAGTSLLTEASVHAATADPSPDNNSQEWTFGSPSRRRVVRR